MVNSLIRSMSTAIHSEFGDEYRIYTDAVKQGLCRPCFFVLCPEPSAVRARGNRYYRTNRMCVQYLPKDELNSNVECYDTAERLFPALAELTDENGNLLHGCDVRYDVHDGVLSFFVSYNMFVYRKEEEKEKMGKITIKAYAGKEDIL